MARKTLYNNIKDELERLCRSQKQLHFYDYDCDTKELKDFKNLFGEGIIDSISEVTHEEDIEVINKMLIMYNMEYIIHLVDWCVNEEDDNTIEGYWIVRRKSDLICKRMKYCFRTQLS